MKDIQLVNKMKSFTEILSQKMGINKDDWELGIQNSTYSAVLHNGKMWDSERKYNQLSIGYKDECIDIEFIEYDTDKFELYWFEVKGEQCKGVGTDALNHILDTCEETKINLILTPVPLTTCMLSKEYQPAIQRLRNWYNSFGFKSFNPKTPQMIYNY
jgi:GNAT superfamily N-acetyltransferase